MKKPKLIELVKTLKAQNQEQQVKINDLQDQNDLLALDNAETEQKISEIREHNRILKSRIRVLQAMADSESRQRVLEMLMASKD